MSNKMLSWVLWWKQVSDKVKRAKRPTPPSPNQQHLHLGWPKNRISTEGSFLCKQCKLLTKTYRPCQESKYPAKIVIIVSRKICNCWLGFVVIDRKDGIKYSLLQSNTSLTPTVSPSTSTMQCSFYFIINTQHLKMLHHVFSIQCPGEHALSPKTKQRQPLYKHT